MKAQPKTSSWRVLARTTSLAPWRQIQGQTHGPRPTPNPLGASTSPSVSEPHSAPAHPATPAAAQPVMALGHPLPDSKLDGGTISVRVIAGSPSQNVVEHGRDARRERHAAPGASHRRYESRRSSRSLPVGATVQAKVLDADKKEVASDQFAVPETGGAVVMLTTKPFVGGGMMGGAAAPMAGGAGMPEPRQLSGEPLYPSQTIRRARSPCASPTTTSRTPRPSACRSRSSRTRTTTTRSA